MKGRSVPVWMAAAALAAFAGWGLGAPDSAVPEDGRLVKNGDFERADPEDAAKPRGWFKPDGLGVQWVADEGPEADRHGRVIRLDTAVSETAMVERWTQVGLNAFWDIPNPKENPVAATYGLSYYSDAFPVVSGQAYRVTFDFKTTASGGGAKLWVRGYGLFRGEKRRRYETLVTCREGGQHWRRFSHLFHPTRHRPEVTDMKVMLYAYWPPGLYWFDNVTIEPVADATALPSEDSP